MKITSEEVAKRKEEDRQFYKQVVLTYINKAANEIAPDRLANYAHAAGERAVKHLQAERGLIDESYI